MGAQNSKDSSSDRGWKDAYVSAMLCDRGRLTMTQTGNPYFDAIGGTMFKNTFDESNRQWERARELAERQGAKEEFERKKKEWDDYMFDEMFPD